MAQGTLSLPAGGLQIQTVKQQTYWGAVLTKLFRDKLTVLGIFLLVFMVTISVACALDWQQSLGLQSH